MSGIKTGNKGFVNPADGKVYTIDPNGNADEVSTTYDPGDMTVDQTVKDVNKKTKITLGTYLSKATKGEVGAATKPNKYPIDASTEASKESSLRDSGGYPAGLTPGQSGNTSKFDSGLPSSLSKDFSDHQGVSTNTKIIKGLSAEVGQDGHVLLKSVTPVTDPNSPVQQYQGKAFDPSYGTVGTKYTTEDILNPSKSFNPALLDYTKISFAPDPGSTTVASSNLSLRLDKVVATDTSVFNFASGLTGKNFFPVLANDSLGTNLADLKSITENGVPPTLATAESQNTKVFASGLRNSYTDDYTNLSVNNTDGLQKGKTVFSIDPTTPKPSGNSFLSKIVIEGTSIKAGTGLDFLKNYTESAISPNYRNTAGQFTTEDILSPSGKFDYKLIDYSSLQKVEPKTEAVKQGDLTLTLSSIFNFASKLTNPAAGFISLTTSAKNSYPVSAPDKFSADSLYPITTDGFPSPRNVGTNKNTFAFNDNLPSSYSAEFDIVSGQFKKGKQNTSGVDGHALLSKSIITDSFGFTQLNLSLQNYFENVAAVNFFYPNISNSGLSSEKAFLSKQIDISSPPRSFEPIINIGTSFGKYSGKESLKTQWNLIDQRKKASEVTQVNQYSVDPPVGGPFDILIPTNDPSTSLPLPLVQNNNDSYVKREDIKPLSRDPSIQNFSKGKESANLINGNELLKDVPGGIPGINESNPLHNYVGGRGAAVLSVGNNRFTNSSAVGKGFNPTLKLADGTVVSHLKLAQVGTGLLQRAAAEIPAWIANPDSKFNPTSDIAELGALVPSVAQLGILKVNNALLEAKDVLNSLSGVSTTGEISGEEEALVEDSLTSIAPFDGQSWGTFTTPSELYDDPSSIGLAITMILLVIAISLLFGLFEFANNTQTVKSNSKGQLTLGKFKYVSSDDGGFASTIFNLENTMGIRPTNNTFATCLGVGAKAFFIGASNAHLSDGQVAAAALGIGLDGIIGEGSAVGANLTVARTIIRSGLVLAQAYDRIAKAAAQNTGAALKAGAGLSKILRSSKLVAAINVFAQLGDTLLDRQLADIVGPDGTRMPGGGIDLQNPAGFHSTVRKNRLSYFDLVLDPIKEEVKNVLIYNKEIAWASKRAPSIYLIPSSVAGLQKYSNLTVAGSPLKAFSGALSLSQPSKEDKSATTKTYNNVIDRRIPNALREKLEEVLDAEYVPFYFHDIRTNEIISFHAFLTSLSDDYSASYDSIEGFGRVEPVKIYKGTQRKIGISFTIAATSEDDFQHMWFKINKLVTLAYPQYTAGRTLVGTDYQFKAPFSQMIGASPLIRLRLGDLLRSNYSRFGLSRLFGAVDGDMKIPVPGSTEKIEINSKTLASEENLNSKKRNDVLSQFNYLKPFGSQDEDGKNTAQFEKKKVKLKYAPDPYAPGMNGKQFTKDQVVEATIAGREKSGFYLVDIKYKTVSKPDNPAAPPSTDEVKSIIMPKQHLILTDEAINELVGETGDDTTDALKAHDALVEFMSPGTNVIVRSFESAGGKGLAGVIESMNFDWYNQATWEILPGYTAPKMCKVSLSFSPIHDITPGIDHLGYNRAPVYPVGNAMNGKGST